MADQTTIYPPVVDHVRADLAALGRALQSEVPGSIIAVVWGSNRWQRHKPGNNKEHLAEDPWSNVTKRSFVMLDGLEITEHESASKILEERYVPGNRLHKSDEKMTIGTYWRRFYDGMPEPDHVNSPCKAMAEPEGGFTPILNVATKSKALGMAVAVKMKEYFLKSGIGHSLLIIPPDDRQELVSASWGFQEEVNQQFVPKTS